MTCLQTPVYRFVKGYDKTPGIPGQLITHNKAKYTFNKSNLAGNLLTYHCAAKHITKCKAKCQVTALEFENSEKKFILNKYANLEEHNHPTDEGEILVQDMIVEMEKRFSERLSEKPSVIRKQVCLEYRAKYGKTLLWDEILEHIQSDAVIDRKLTRIREKKWGNLPKNRDDLDILRVIDNLDGNDDLVVMDSNALMENDEFRSKIEDLNIVDQHEEASDRSRPPRVLTVSSPFCLNLLGVCKKGSVDGTFKIAPSNWAQIFILMAKYDDKWVPVAFSFLPDKKESSYKLFFAMIEFELQRRGIQISLEKLLCDFEIGIQKAALSVFETLIVLGCFFHFGQSVWKHAQQEKLAQLCEHNLKFKQFIRQCISLPMVRLEELQDTIDELRREDFEDSEHNNLKEEFLNYIQTVWVDGVYPPQTWNCFRRKDDNTNNSQEAYNGVLNRLIQVSHPNPYVLLSHLQSELSNAQFTIEKSKKAKKVKFQKSNYANLQEETEDLKEKYTKKLITRREYLISMGHKIQNLDKEARRVHSTPQAVEEESDDPGPLRLRLTRAGPSGHFALAPQDTTNDDPLDFPLNDTIADVDHPYVGRQVGVTARGTAARAEIPDNPTKNKKCPACGGKFVNGKKKKSKYIACISCDNLTHAKCGSQKTPFHCQKCDVAPPEDLNNSDLNGNIDVDVETNEVAEGHVNVQVDFDEEILNQIPFIIAGSDGIASVPEIEVPYVPEPEATFVPEPEVPHVPEPEVPHVPELQVPHVPEPQVPDVADSDVQEFIEENISSFEYPILNNSISLFICKRCQLTFNEKEELRIHELSHKIDEDLNLSDMDIESSFLVALGSAPSTSIHNVLEKSHSFLTRHMYDGSERELDSALGDHEHPLLESTVLENHPACNIFCNGGQAEDENTIDDTVKDLVLEESTEHHVQGDEESSLLLVLEDSSDEEETRVQENRKKRKYTEPLRVVFVGSLPKSSLIHNIPVKRRRKNNKW